MNILKKILPEFILFHEKRLTFEETGERQAEFTKENTKKYTIQKGDTLSEIAKKEGLPVTAFTLLQEFHNIQVDNKKSGEKITDPSKISVGKILYLPTNKEVIAKYLKERTKIISSTTTEKTNINESVRVTVQEKMSNIKAKEHTISKNESLITLAKKYNISDWRKLKEFHNAHAKKENKKNAPLIGDNNRIIAGKILYLPESDTAMKELEEQIPAAYVEHFWEGKEAEREDLKRVSRERVLDFSKASSENTKRTTVIRETDPNKAAAALQKNVDQVMQAARLQTEAMNEDVAYQQAYQRMLDDIDNFSREWNSGFGNGFQYKTDRGVMGWFNNDLYDEKMIKNTQGKDKNADILLHIQDTTHETYSKVLTTKKEGTAFDNQKFSTEGLRFLKDSAVATAIGTALASGIGSLIEGDPRLIITPLVMIGEIKTGQKDIATLKESDIRELGLFEHYVKTMYAIGNLIAKEKAKDPKNQDQEKIKMLEKEYREYSARFQLLLNHIERERNNTLEGLLNQRLDNLKYQSDDYKKYEYHDSLDLAIIQNLEHTKAVKYVELGKAFKKADEDEKSEKLKALTDFVETEIKVSKSIVQKFNEAEKSRGNENAKEYFAKKFKEYDDKLKKGEAITEEDKNPLLYTTYLDPLKIGDKRVKAQDLPTGAKEAETLVQYSTETLAAAREGKISDKHLLTADQQKEFTYKKEKLEEAKKTQKEGLKPMGEHFDDEAYKHRTLGWFRDIFCDIELNEKNIDAEIAKHEGKIKKLSAEEKKLKDEIETKANTGRNEVAKDYGKNEVADQSSEVLFEILNKKETEDLKVSKDLMQFLGAVIPEFDKTTYLGGKDIKSPEKFYRTYLEIGKDQFSPKGNVDIRFARLKNGEIMAKDRKMWNFYDHKGSEIDDLYNTICNKIFSKLKDSGISSLKELQAIQMLDREGINDFTNDVLNGTKRKKYEKIKADLDIDYELIDLINKKERIKTNLAKNEPSIKQGIQAAFEELVKYESASSEIEDSIKVDNDLYDAEKASNVNQVIKKRFEASKNMDAEANRIIAFIESVELRNEFFRGLKGKSIETSAVANEIKDMELQLDKVNVFIEILNKYPVDTKNLPTTGTVSPETAALIRQIQEKIVPLTHEINDVLKVFYKVSSDGKIEGAERSELDESMGKIKKQISEIQPLADQALKVNTPEKGKNLDQHFNEVYKRHDTAIQGQVNENYDSLEFAETEMLQKVNELDGYLKFKNPIQSKTNIENNLKNLDLNENSWKLSPKEKIIKSEKVKTIIAKKCNELKGIKIPMNEHTCPSILDAARYYQMAYHLSEAGALDDWNKFKTEVKTKFNIDLKHHTSPATTSRLEMTNDRAVNMLILQLPAQDKFENLEARPAASETIITTLRRAGIDIRPTDLLQAIGNAQEIEGEEISSTYGKTFNTGANNYYPTEGSNSEYNLKKGYLAKFSKEVEMPLDPSNPNQENQPKRKFNAEFYILFRKECFNVNIPQEKFLETSYIEVHLRPPLPGTTITPDAVYEAIGRSTLPLYVGWPIEIGIGGGKPPVAPPPPGKVPDAGGAL